MDKTGFRGWKQMNPQPTNNKGGYRLLAKLQEPALPSFDWIQSDQTC